VLKVFSQLRCDINRETGQVTCVPCGRGLGGLAFDLDIELVNFLLEFKILGGEAFVAVFELSK
jgi:hypothetical protein